MVIVFVVVSVIILLSVLWGPTLLILKSLGRPIRSKFCLGLLVTELVITLVLVFFADLVDLNNPGGIIIAAVVVASFLGLVYALVRVWRRR